MSTTRKLRPTLLLDWLLLADAGRARLFWRDPDNGALREVEAFVQPKARLKGRALDHDRPGKVSKGQASTAFAPHTDPHQKERESFARALAHHLEQAALEHRYPRLSILASSPFLGELRAHLGTATRRLLGAALPLDLTALQGAELEHRVTEALQQADSTSAAG